MEMRETGAGRPGDVTVRVTAGGSTLLDAATGTAVVCCLTSPPAWAEDVVSVATVCTCDGPEEAEAVAMELAATVGRLCRAVGRECPGLLGRVAKRLVEPDGPKMRDGGRR